MLRGIVLLAGFACILLAPGVPAQDYAPLPDCRIADPTGEYYVVWKRLGGPKHFGEWGPTALAIARRAPGTPPVSTAQAYIENLGLYDPGQGGQLYKMLDDPDVTVRSGDKVHGRAIFPRPPRVVLVSSRGLGLVALDVYGDNLPAVVEGPGGHALVVVSLRGKVRHAKRLAELFSQEEIRKFPSTPSIISWLRGGWINEDRQDLILVDGNNRLRAVNLITGQVRDANDTDILRGLHSADHAAIKQALVLITERKTAGVLQPVHDLFESPTTRPDVRLRAAVALAVLGDRSGATLIRKTAAGSLPQDTSGQDRERQSQCAVAIEYLPEAIGTEGLRILAAAISGNRAEQSAAFKAFLKLEAESVDTLIPLAGGGQSRAVRLAAIGILGGIGPAARPAVPKLIKVLKDRDPLIRVKAAFALAQIDPARDEGLPVLRDALRFDTHRAGHFPVREAATECLVGLGPHTMPIVIEGMGDPDATVRRAVVRALARLGPKARQFSDELVERLNDEDKDVRDRAVEALAQMGSGAVPSLIRGLRHENVRVRRDSAFVLGKIGPTAESSAPALTALLHDREPSVRGAAAVALGQIDPETTSREGVETLIELLAHPDANIRARAARSLGHYGPRAKQAGGPLANLLNDTNRVVAAAAWALGNIRPPADVAVPGLIAALEHRDRLVRRAAAESLGCFGPAAKQAVPELIERLQDEDWRVPYLAAQTLGRIGPEAREAIAPLATIVSNRQSDSTLRLAAVEALGRLGPDAKVATAGLIDALADPCAEVATKAVDVLAAFGPDAVPGLIRALKTPNPDVRCRAARALGQIGADATKAAPALIKALADGDAATGFYSEEPLKRIGPAALPFLVEALDDEHENVRAGAVRILGHFGPESKPAVPALVESLDDPDDTVRAGAASALGNIGTAARPALARLTAALQDNCISVRRTAASALKKIRSARENPDSKSKEKNLAD